MKTATRRSVAAACLWLAATACGSREQEAKSAAAPAAAAPAPPPAARAEPAAAAPPGPAAQPEVAPAGDAARGRALYVQYCASCHGEHGDGKGPLSASLNPPPANHSDGKYMNALSDEHLFKVIQQGGAAVGKSPLMAPWGGVLSPAQTRDVIAFIRSIAVPPYPGP